MPFGMPFISTRVGFFIGDRQMPILEKTAKQIGKKFGMLTIRSIYRKENERGRVTTYANCDCDCGRTKEIVFNEVTAKRNIGLGLGCGCNKNKPTHGQTIGKKVSVEYTAWLSMKARCYYKPYECHSRYGDRGISVCPEWENSFEAFFAFMGKRPSAKHSIDRINNDGNYEPGNVRWATAKEQSDNRSITLKFEVGGKIMNIAELSEMCGVKGRTIRKRLQRGCSLDQALTLNDRCKIAQ
jgi:hypothetical protein